MTTTILLDGDITAFQFGTKAEQAWDWGNGISTLHADHDNVIREIDDYLKTLVEDLDADRLIVALSDRENFRKKVLHSYKGNRKDTRKPVCHGAVLEHMETTYEVWQRPGLEGDDILGILATSRKIVKGRKILVSIDKDMNCLPCNLLNLNHARELVIDGVAEDRSEGRNMAITEITLAQADHYHLTQTLTGDTTDGYSGCPGVGKVGAAKLLDPHMEDEEFDVAAAWETVVAAFEKAKFGEQEALVQARVARILRNSDYDFKSKEPILWTPPL